MNISAFAKAVVGPALGLIGGLAQYAATGHLDRQTLIYLGVGLLGGIVTYLVPNAAPEVQAVEAAFNPPTAGHPDPEAAPPLVAAVPDPAPATPPAA